MALYVTAPLNKPRIKHIGEVSQPHINTAQDGV
jgi:hypothetical protein